MTKEIGVVKLIMAMLLVLVVIYVVPFLLYGGASVLWDLRPPTSASPSRFLFGVLVTKLGTAFAFVAIFAVSTATWGPRWMLYATLWFVMFVFSELGEVVSGRWTTLDAVLGVVSEAIYFPVSAFITQWLLGGGTA
jgi:hypothetical protein